MTGLAGYVQTQVSYSWVDRLIDWARTEPVAGAVIIFAVGWVLGIVVALRLFRFKD